MESLLTLYHYTTEVGLNGIKQDKKINKATRHAHYGEGAYFTTFQPTCNKYFIAEKIFRAGAQFNKQKGHVDYYVEIKLHSDEHPKLKCVDEKRDVYLYKGKVGVKLYKFNHVRFGKTNTEEFEDFINDGIDVDDSDDETDKPQSQLKSVAKENGQLTAENTIVQNVCLRGRKRKIVIDRKYDLRPRRLRMVPSIQNFYNLRKRTKRF